MDKLEAIAEAHKASKANGYAYAVQWPAGHWTVETRKPSLRQSGMTVIECEEGRESLA